MLWRSIFLVILLQPGLLLWGGPCLAATAVAPASRADTGCCAVVKTCIVDKPCCPAPAEKRPECPFCTCGEKLPFGPYVPIDDLLLVGSERPAAPAAISFAYANRVDAVAASRRVEPRRGPPDQSTRRAMLCIWLN